MKRIVIYILVSLLNIGIQAQDLRSLVGDSVKLENAKDSLLAVATMTMDLCDYADSLMNSGSYYTAMTIYAGFFENKVLPDKYYLSYSNCAIQTKEYDIVLSVGQDYMNRYFGKYTERDILICSMMKIVYKFREQYKDALLQAERVLMLSRKINNKEKEAEAYMDLSDCYYNLKNYMLSSKFARESADKTLNYLGITEESLLRKKIDNYVLGYDYLLLGMNAIQEGESRIKYEKYFRIGKNCGNEGCENVCKTLDQNPE